MDNEINNEEREKVIKNYGLLEYTVMGIAYWKLTTKYFGALFASIFAIILAKPEVPKAIIFHGVKLSYIIYFYFMIGGIGLLQSSIKEATEEVLKTKQTVPIVIKKIVVGYLFIGLGIFMALLYRVLEL